MATAANVHDATILPDLLHGEETRVWGDSAYRGQDAVIQAQAPKARDLPNHHYRYKGVVNEVERAKNLVKSQIRSRVEHVFGVIKGAFPFASGPLPGSRKERPPALCHLRAGQSVPCAPTAVATLKGVIRLEIGFQAIKGLPNKEIKPHRGATVHLGGPPWQNPVSASCACRNGGGLDQMCPNLTVSQSVPGALGPAARTARECTSDGASQQNAQRGDRVGNVALHSSGGHAACRLWVRETLVIE